jgi:hypothetical protein
MQIIRTTFDLSDKIASGIARNKYVRMGGVVREAAGKRIVQHLREASTSPQALGRVTCGGINSLLKFGNVASILNLGATVAFGIATFRKLDKIDSRLDETDRKLEKVAWTVERVYETLRQFQTQSVSELTTGGKRSYETVVK